MNKIDNPWKQQTIFFNNAIKVFRTFISSRALRKLFRDKPGNTNGLAFQKTKPIILQISNLIGLASRTEIHFIIRICFGRKKVDNFEVMSFSTSLLAEILQNVFSIFRCMALHATLPFVVNTYWLIISCHCADNPWKQFLSKDVGKQTVHCILWTNFLRKACKHDFN